LTWYRSEQVNLCGDGVLELYRDRRLRTWPTETCFGFLFKLPCKSHFDCIGEFQPNTECITDGEKNDWRLKADENIF